MKKQSSAKKTSAKKTTAKKAAKTAKPAKVVKAGKATKSKAAVDDEEEFGDFDGGEEIKLDELNHNLDDEDEDEFYVGDDF